MANVFDALALGGHAKLIAWRAVDGGAMVQDRDMETALFSQLMETAKNSLAPERHRDVRQMIYLVATAAIGHGLAGNGLAAVLNLSDQEVDEFPTWVQQRLS